jgi:acyl CoA:acetate/3-ketoacid CoA transferase alpha subunit
MTAGGVTSSVEAVSHVRSGDTLMVGGFGLVGAPLTLIDALVEHSDATDLTIVSNNIGEPAQGSAGCSARDGSGGGSRRTSPRTRKRSRR